MKTWSLQRHQAGEPWLIGLRIVPLHLWDTRAGFVVVLGVGVGTLGWRSRGGAPMNLRAVFRVPLRRRRGKSPISVGLIASRKFGPLGLAWRSPRGKR